VDDGGKQSFSKNTESLSPVKDSGDIAGGDSGDSGDRTAGGDSGDSTVGDGVNGQVADDGDAGDDVSVPGFLASRGREPFVLILLTAATREGFFNIFLTFFYFLEKKVRNRYYMMSYTI